MMRADSEPSGETQSMPDPVEMLVRVGVTRRTAPTPNAAATAATSAWRRVRTCFAKAMRPVSASTVWPESAECEEFVSERRFPPHRVGRSGGGVRPWACLGGLLLGNVVSAMAGTPATEREALDSYSA